MDPNRWQAINEIFHAALELPPGERAGFVAKAVASDHELQAEVELLLQADADAGSYIEPRRLETSLLRGMAPSVGPGDILSERFRILREVAEGGMGQVYEAFDSELAVRVALKVIRPEIASDPEALRRFRQEVQLARRITHPNVCRTYDLERENGFGTATDLLFLTMEFLDGETLAAKIERTGALPLQEALEIARQVADALDAAHALGIVHRDIKPTNIMLVPLPGGKQGFRAVITDFGLARNDPLVAQPSTLALSQTARPIGTPAYMAPEQLEGTRVSAATDIYAFGLVLFEMVTGKRAFPSDNFLSGLARRLTGATPDPRLLVPSLPQPWARAMVGCLRARPKERFKSAADVIAVLKGGKAKAAQRRIVLAFALGVLAMLLAGGIYYGARHGRHLKEKDTVVLADFANSTGEGVFDDALKTALMVSLNQSPFLNVLQENKMSETITLMTLPAHTQLIPELAREVCQRTGSKAYIAGSIARLGNKYVLGLNAVNCQSDESLAQVQVTANGKESVLNALGSAVSAMRGKLGESLNSLQQYDVPLADATTSSLEALKALSLGRKAYRQDTGVALRYFQQARELDPNFAMAYHDLGRLYFTLDETEMGRANFARAFELRNHSSEREKLEITATYYENVTGELEKALFTRRQQLVSYPLVSESYDGLGYVSSLLGKYDVALDIFRQSIRLNPDNPDTYGLLANSLLALQQLEESRTVIRQAHSRKIDGLLLHTALYDLAFLTGDAAAITAEEHWMQDQPQYEHFGYSVASDSKAYTGHLRDARELTRMAVDSSINADSKETGAIWYENAALREAAFGEPKEAKLAAKNGLKMDPTSVNVGVEAALAYALAGDNAQAESLANALSKRFSLDTQVRSVWLPAVRAQVALNRNEPSSAIQDLQSSVPLEFGQYPFNTYGSCLYTTYLRGQAYLAAGLDKLSADEFQKILDHSGIVGNCWTGALARLGIARANAAQVSSPQSRNTDPARTRALFNYNDFLTLWKDADAGIPVFRQAKSERAKLAGEIPR
jgi:eukaryotic-like serine/threonine-protein kinase